jgi:putative two-component system response regulator
MTSLAYDHPAIAPAPAARILVVDDEDTIRLVLGKFLRTRGFDVGTADCGDAALEMLTQSHFDLMLCDVRMPGMSGVEIVPRALEIRPDLGIVMLSAVNDAPTATEAMAQGVLDYLTKPIELQALHDAVRRALHRRTLVREQHRTERAIREEVAARTRELEQEQAHLREMTVRVVETLVNAMEAKDVFQRGHSARVGELAASIAEAMRLPPDVVEDVRIAGRLHDIGNIGVREDLLSKPGPLNPDEFALVKDHVRIGVEMLQPMTHIGRAVSFIANHHERFDGSGYPRGRSGDAISVGGRILAAADCYDALTSRRAYRGPLDPEAAVEHLRSQSGRMIDPVVYEALRVVVQRHMALTFIDSRHA